MGSCNVQAEAEETVECLKITIEHARHPVAPEISISIDCKSVTRTGKKRILCVVCNVERYIENTRILSALLENSSSSSSYSSSSSSIGTTAHCGLWPVEQCPSIFSYLPPALSIFSLPALEDLFQLPLSILSWVFPFFSSLPVLERRSFWSSYPPPFCLGDLTSVSFALLSILLYFLLCSPLIVLDSSDFSIPRFAKLYRFSQFTGPCGSQSPSAAQINISAVVMLIYITAIGAGTCNSISSVFMSRKERKVGEKQFPVYKIVRDFSGRWQYPLQFF